MLRREATIDDPYQFYNDHGRALARSWFVNTVLVFVVVGIQIFMCLYGLWVFYETPKSLRKGRGRFIVISFAILFTYSSMAIMDGVTLFTTLLGSGANGFDIILSFLDVDISWGAASTVMLTLCMAIGDSVMIWRCYVLWQDRKWVIFGPVIILIAFIGIGCSLAAPAVSTHLKAEAFSAASYFLSVGVNLIVTLLILGRLLQTRKVVREANLTERPSSMYRDVAAILIESAAPLVIFGTILVILKLTSMLIRSVPLRTNTHLNVASHVFSLLYVACIALSPQLIIFRVTTGRSWKNARESQQATTALSQPIQFGRPVPNEDEDVSSIAESTRSRSLAPLQNQGLESREKKKEDPEAV
ncbi:hypothetical protein BKA70DRAFT_1450239 [Coprinopsis sp. MPI-PUGE-AT-0042]|nr:hypothetical protein BKA70DRAFT_1450239 [Coprinopsis sp. MPI-PUGE-AT-0042]